MSGNRRQEIPLQVGLTPFSRYLCEENHILFKNALTLFHNFVNSPLKFYA